MFVTRENLTSEKSIFPKTIKTCIKLRDKAYKLTCTTNCVLTVSYRRFTKRETEEEICSAKYQNELRDKNV